MFPLAPGGKRPILDGGYKVATNDPQVLSEWAETYPDANVGHCPDHSGHWVLDVDGEQGKATLREIEAEHGPLPTTFTTETPSGGLHLWFEGEAPTSARTLLGPGLDTRGRGGYVAIEPSVIDGKPYISNEADPAPTPAWLSEVFEAKKQEEKEALTDDLDTNLAISHAVKYAKECEPAIEGEGGDQRTYEVAAEIKDKGVSEDRCLEIMLEYFNPRCEPPWDEETLSVKVENCYKYGQNEPGAKALSNTAKVFQDAVRYAEADNPAPSGTAGKKERFRLRDEVAQDNRKPPEWIIPGWIPESSLVMLYGPPGSYKSFIAVEAALSVAAGRQCWNQPEVKQGDVIYLAGEGAIGIEQKRRPAWRVARAIPEDEKLPFWTADDMPILRRGENEIPTFVEAVKNQGVTPKLIIVDTLARMGAGMDENSAADASTLIYQLDVLRDSFPHSTVVAVHHAGKDEGRGARGSSALMAGFDVIIQCKGDPATKTVTLSAGAPHGKMKDSEPLAPIHFQGVEALQSMIFDTIPAGKFHELKVSIKDITPQMVVKAIKDLGEGAYVTTQVLAMQITQSDDPGSKEVKEAMKQLGAKAKGEFAEFVNDDGTWECS